MWALNMIQPHYYNDTLQIVAAPMVQMKMYPTFSSRLVKLLKWIYFTPLKYI